MQAEYFSDSTIRFVWIVETWCLTIRDEQMLRDFEGQIQRCELSEEWRRSYARETIRGEPRKTKKSGRPRAR